MVKRCVFGGFGCEMCFMCVCVCGFCDRVVFLFFFLNTGKKLQHSQRLAVCVEYAHWRLQ